MNFNEESILTQSRISIKSLLPEIGTDEVREEIVRGLQSRHKHISSKYFYNEAGSLLFEDITHLEEYYPTRTEKSILRSIAPSLMNKYGSYDILELGSGDCSKVAILISAVPDAGEVLYLPLDFSESAIKDSAKGIVHTFPKVEVEGYVVDFTSQFDLIQRKNPVLICFFGSTIGNFKREDSMKLMKNISSHMKEGDILLLGMDLVKDESVLHAAYNDAKGVTEAFNKNILSTVNAILEADFNPEDFDHLAGFNTEKARMEMHLVARKDMTIHSPFFDSDVSIQKGEQIHTENSHKYTPNDIHTIADAAQLNISKIHTDDKDWFALVELKK